MPVVAKAPSSLLSLGVLHTGVDLEVLVEDVVVLGPAGGEDLVSIEALRDGTGADVDTSNFALVAVSDHGADAEHSVESRLSYVQLYFSFRVQPDHLFVSVFQN